MATLARIADAIVAGRSPAVLARDTLIGVAIATATIGALLAIMAMGAVS